MASSGSQNRSQQLLCLGAWSGQAELAEQRQSVADHVLALAELAALDAIAAEREERAPEGGLLVDRAEDLDRVEEDLRRALGTKVRLARSRKGGRIVIEFYSDDELGRLYERLIGGTA